MYIVTKINYGTEERLFLPAELNVGSNLEVGIQNLHCFSIGMEGGKYQVSLRDDRANTVLQCMGASFASGEINRLFHVNRPEIFGLVYL